jgi:amidase
VVPAGRTADGLPVGIQIIGPYLEDRTVTDVARRIAALTGGFHAPPVADFRNDSQGVGTCSR